MADQYILSIDQGTTGTTVALMNKKGLLIALATKNFEQIYPKPSWLEHKPKDIWSSLSEACIEVIEAAKINPSSIAIIGITNQRETSVVWDRKTGEPIFNAIVWQCRRTADFCQQLKNEGLEKNIKNKTGLVLDPYFSASKFRWILQNAPKVIDQKSLCAGTIDSFLLFKLTGGSVHATDVSNASRTQLMNIDNLSWDKDLLKIFSIPEEILPEIRTSSEVYGLTKGLSFLPDGIPISAMVGDQQAALFGHFGTEEGSAKCTFGTGSFILVNSGEKRIDSSKGLLTTVAWQLKGKKVFYALEGGAFICGAAVEWLRDGLGIISESSDVESLAAQVSDTAGVQVVPAFAGLGAPHWKPEARALISGLTRKATKAHIARATLEAMAWQNVEILQCMESDLQKNITDLRVDGGASKNDLLMQMQSDFMGQKLIRPQVIETTVAGAAFLAGLAVGFWSTLEDIQKNYTLSQEFTPQLSEEVRRKKFSLWSQAVSKTF